MGRLDRDSRGLLLFVKDPSWVERLTQPGSFEKVYEVWVRGHVQPHHLEKISQGIESPLGLLTCERVSIEGYVGPKTRLHVVLTEGKNRQIRRIFGALHDDVFGTPLKVLDLKRIQFGPVKLDVPSGHWRMLSDSEIEDLNAEAQSTQS